MLEKISIAKKQYMYQYMDLFVGKYINADSTTSENKKNEITNNIWC